MEVDYGRIKIQFEQNNANTGNHNRLLICTQCNYEMKRKHKSTPRKTQRRRNKLQHKIPLLPKNIY